MILSGGDSAAVALLAAATSGLQTGYDPTYVGVLDDLKSAGDFSHFIYAALKTAPDAAMIYLDYDSFWQPMPPVSIWWPPFTLTVVGWMPGPFAPSIPPRCGRSGACWNCAWIKSRPMTLKV